MPNIPIHRVSAEDKSNHGALTIPIEKPADACTPARLLELSPQLNDMPARDGRSNRRRARTVPELSPESSGDHDAGEAANSDRGRSKRGGQGAAPHGGGAAAGSTKSGAKGTVQATNAEVRARN